MAESAVISPEAETKNVSKIDRLMALQRKLSKSATRNLPPSRLRGSGAWSSSKRPREPPKANLPPLPTKRRMQDSYVEMDLRFSENPELAQDYIGAHTSVRTGRLMEDFDSVAGMAAYKHVMPDGTTPADAYDYGLYLVTASVSRMDLLRPLKEPNGHVPDLRLSGHVSYTSTSSLEVFVRLSTLPVQGDGETILLGRFAMACRSYAGGKHPIAQLEVSGPDEQNLFQMGKEMREEKTARAASSLEKSPPNEIEAKRMHDIFIGKAKLYERNAAVPPEVVFMSDTVLSSAVLQHPQESNVHGKVFGGYIMRIAYEQAYSTACLFARNPVTFIALDEIRFANPVEVGSLLSLKSQVTFAPLHGEHSSFHVSVEASTIDLYTGEKKITNVFHLTFAAPKPLERYVLPRSYKQAMAWLDAQRRREEGIAIRRAYGL